MISTEHTCDQCTQTTDISNEVNAAIIEGLQLARNEIIRLGNHNNPSDYVRAKENALICINKLIIQYQDKIK